MVSDRWRSLAVQRAGMLGKPTMSAATDIHIGMVLAGAGRHEALAAQIAVMSGYDPATVSARFLEARPTAAAICRAMRAHALGDFGGAARLLRALGPERSTLAEREAQGRGLAADVHPVGLLVPDAWRCIGLSNAQRDVLTQLLVSACYHSADDGDRALAAAVLAQRRAASLDAGWGGRMEQRARAGALSQPAKL
jgi:hypothetical protein